MRRPAATIALLLALALAAAAGAVLAPSTRAARPEATAGDAPAPASADAPLCVCKLHSWVVAGRGRHMFARIDCPSPFDTLSTIVEFGAGVQRTDFVGPIDPDNMPRVVKINRGMQLRPFFGAEMVTRLEAELRISPAAARELQRDRMFTAPYVMLGANSNSGMRAAFAVAGLELPALVLAGAGVRGEFPGVEHVLGEELPPEEWARYGVPGPEPDPPEPR